MTISIDLKHGRGQEEGDSDKSSSDAADLDGPLFRPVANNRTGMLDSARQASRSRFHL